jgi:hypothetical protein
LFAHASVIITQSFAESTSRAFALEANANAAMALKAMIILRIVVALVFAM